MKSRVSVWLAAAILSTAACSRPSSDSGAAVRGFMAAVARDVTAEGPAAWRRHFASDPAFFMVSNGRLEFSDGASAQQGIGRLEKIIRRIDLQWGNDLRVDSVAPGLAVVGCSFHEVLVNMEDRRSEDRGFFTATAQYRGGRWQFRNAHWSVPVPPAETH